jgi:RimJ/RimL family protein N-acetyltransferase
VEPVTLAGQHVRLVPLTVEHAQDLLAAAMGDRRTFAYTWVPDGAQDVRRYLAKALTDQAAGTALPFATTRASDGEVIGSTRFMNAERWEWSRARVHPDAVEIGSTWLTASAQRTPVNTEAKLLMLTHAFEVWKVLRVTLKTDARNARSRDAILRLGAHFDGVLRAHMPAYDIAEPRDSAFYSILASEWPGVRDRLTEALEGIPGGGPAAR